MPDRTFVVTGSWLFNYSRGNLIPEAQMPGDPDELLAADAVRLATAPEIAAGYVDPADLPATPAETEAAAHQVAMADAYAASAALNPQLKGDPWVAMDAWRNKPGGSEKQQVEQSGERDGDAAQKPAAAPVPVKTKAAKKEGGTTHG